MKSPLRVLFITAEAEPFVKIGGLGDYSGSLPKEIADLNSPDASITDIRVALPFHAGIEAHVSNLIKVASFGVQIQKGYAKGQIFQFIFNNIIYYLIKRSGNPSGYRNVYNPTPLEDARKYIFFSAACLEIFKIINWVPDIIHANDWHTAISVFRLEEKRRTEKYFKEIRSLLTVHNLPYLGEGSQPVLREYLLPPLKSPNFPTWAKHLPLPMGLEKADEIVAVSPSYAEELKQEEYGDGLANFFIQNTKKTTGILNGIDTQLWNPETDITITQNFSVDQLNLRRINKEKLLQDFDLEKNADQPLLVLISRLSHQKGINLIIEGLPQLLNENWSAIFLGSGQVELENGLKELESKAPNRIRTVFEFNNTLAHHLYASGDILLMPSLYEPCGLSQMIAMRYGCVPVARAVGGLKDSICNSPARSKTGYLFDKPDGLAFANCLRLALNDFDNRAKWEAIQTRAMKADFSWKKFATQYRDLYQAMVAK